MCESSENCELKLDHYASCPDRGELFLDFDPVIPGWPPAADLPTTAGPRRAPAVDDAGALIRLQDFLRLKAAIRDARRLRPAACPNALERKLRRARLVGTDELPGDLITMNTTAHVFDSGTGKLSRVTVVYPHDAGRDEINVSVFSPIGTAILGHRAGQSVGAAPPGGRARSKIEKVLYQPEAAGDLHL